MVLKREQKENYLKAGQLDGYLSVQKPVHYNITKIGKKQ